MKLTEIDNKFTSDEEYVLFEKKTELKHKLINENLYEVSVASIINNKISGNICFVLRNFLKGTKWKTFFEGVKVHTLNENYFYPDVCVSLSRLLKLFIFSKYFTIA